MVFGKIELKKVVSAVGENLKKIVKETKCV